VLATHADLLIQQMCNKVAYLRQGEVAYYGPVDEALAPYHVDARASA
jgi:ABC-type polysaccharide/polyol phosphate transport system ATPase subunit